MLFSILALALLHQSEPIVRGADLGSEPALKQLMKERDDLTETSKWPEATVAAEKVVNAARAQLGEENCETAETMYRLGYLANCAGQHTRAERVWLETLALQEKVCGRESVSTARTLRSLGLLCLQKPEDRQWEDYLERSRRILEKQLGADSLEVAQVIGGMGSGYYYCGEFANAQAEAVRSLEICQRASINAGGTPTNRNHIAWDKDRMSEHALGLLGWISIALHDYGKAEASFSTALASQIKRLGPDDLDTTWSMDGLACAYEHQARFQEAEAMYVRNLHIQERQLEAYERQKLWPTLQKLGEMYLAWGKLDEAETMLRRARAVLDETQLSQKRKLSWSLLSLGEVYEHRGEYQKAYDLIETAAKLQPENLGDFHGSASECSLHLAWLEYEMGHPAEALARVQTVEDWEDQRWREALRFTSEPERLDWLREEERSGSLNLWANLGAADAIARCALRNKAAVVDSLIEDQRLAEASQDKSIRQLMQQLKLARSQVAVANLELGREGPGTANLEARAQSAAARVDAIEADLARRVTGVDFRRTLSIPPSDVQTVLAGNAVLVELIRYHRHLEKGLTEEDYGAVLLPGSGPLRWIPLGPAEMIDDNIAVYKHLVRQSGNPNGLLRSLGDLDRRIWKPISLELPRETERIIFSPDSELNFVSFAGLLEPDGLFLGERYRISYVASGRDLLLEASASTNRGRLTILANPDFGTPIAVASAENALSETTGRLFRGLNFLPLPGAQTESLWLRDRAEKLGFNQVELYLGPEATKHELMSVRAPEVLHLATHGFVLPAEAVTTPNPEGRTGSSSPDANGFLSPMLRSGLALAGAETALKALAQGQPVRPDDDGIVTAEEVCCLDLHGTRLVVLSACDTGIGQAYTGEGVLGLRRGFAQAGAQNLLLTLWPVQDDATSRIIMDFYKNLGQTKNPAEALAETQRRWLKKLRKEKGAAEACRIAGPFVMSVRGPMGKLREPKPEFN